jgi:hypothetical protein
MNQVTQLVEQHVLQSASHLRHIDEMMERARAARQTPAGVETLLDQVKRDRDRLAAELQEIRTQPLGMASDVAERAKAVSGALGTIGSELAKALTAVLDQGAH